MKTEDIRKVRGVYERDPGSGVWWIRYVDAEGLLRREKAGTKSAAITLVGLRKAAAWEGVKLPKLRTRAVRFSELADDYLAHSKGREASRVEMFKAAFGDRPADIPIADLRAWFDARGWQPGSHNRSRTVLSMIYKLGQENKKVEVNSARLLAHLKEPDGKIRYLNQYALDEESRLRAVIAEKFSLHIPELDIALNTGMRSSEQYSRIEWSSVDFLRRDLFIPTSKNGESRHVALNDEALAAFRILFARTHGEGPIFVSERRGSALKGAKHWFEDSVVLSGIQHFRWHDLRHTFASRLVMAGVDLRTVAALLGHKTIQMTMRYSHLSPSHQLAAVEKLATLNRAERVGKAAILDSPEPTGTRTDTGAKSAPESVAGKVQ